MKLISILFCLLAFGLSASSLGQGPTSEHAIGIKSSVRKLGTSDKIVVKLYSDTSYSGTVMSTNDDGFVLLDGSSTSRTIKYADVNSVSRKHGGGPKIGIVIALAAVGTAAVIFAIFKASGKRL
ncbi:MAG TPA: hypothetical protein VGO43_03510 [Pyrinomonadaceae bacterium]|nr:hypothetical protein [Pyrinomonadaceae bacterium]